ncbi:probable nucleoporin Nup54 isoform X1 [Lucilia cuprina]|uniref:probable nucleoporin Nup54 isoform X1 n=1 Tax=Lucilia cuprina TaxID=7375 RepID=UPI001F06D795|nr:probable nucleoporin Nup54 isoform X1 [Lucilia cuprina]
MSFFGANNSLGATSTPAKPTGLFSSFGTGAAGTTSAFGAPATSTTQTGFGTTSAFGAGGFGTSTTAATSAPTLGGFGGFGATNTSTTTAPSLGGFGSFGTGAVQTSQPPSLFGTATSAATGFGGFGGGTATSTAPSFGGFGTTATSAPGGAFGGFGATSTTSTAPAFGGFGAQSSTGGFGGFGTSFGKTAANTTVTPGFGGFGGNTGFMMGQQQQQAPPISADDAFAQSIFNVSIYGDERDAIIAKWNYFQAMWGTGKSFYSQNAAPVEITPQNYLCRFKAMGYSRLPGKDNKMGLVALNFNKSLAEVKNQQQQIINTLNAAFGNKPNLLVNIDSSKESEEKKCQLVIYLEEKSQLSPNDTKRILATDLANYLNQPNVKGQLNNLGIVEILALVLPDEDQLKEYLKNPPKGIDPRMWCQAKLDNPDAAKFIPVPMIGFNELKYRIKCQENETEMHALYLRKVENDLSELRQRHTAATAKIMEYKRNLAELSHKILKIIVKQECTRKVGLALTPEEEALRTKLENMQALVSAPTQFKGRLSELLSQMRMQRNQYALTSGSEYTLDKDCEEEMKTFLGMQQKAMEVLTDTVTKDLKALQIIIDGMPELVRG